MCQHIKKSHKKMNEKNWICCEKKGKRKKDHQEFNTCTTTTCTMHRN